MGGCTEVVVVLAYLLLLLLILGVAQAVGKTRRRNLSHGPPPPSRSPTAGEAVPQPLPRESPADAATGPPRRDALPAARSPAILMAPPTAPSVSPPSQGAEGGTTPFPSHPAANRDTGASAPRVRVQASPSPPPLPSPPPAPLRASPPHRVPPARKGRSVHPARRGGRPRVYRLGVSRSRPRSPSLPPLRAELVCVRHGTGWSLAVEVSCSVPARSLRVHQGDAVLAPDPGRRPAFSLRHPRHPVHIQVEAKDGTIRESIVELPVPFFCRLSADGGHARKVLRLREGSYLLVEASSRLSPLPGVLAECAVRPPAKLANLPDLAALELDLRESDIPAVAGWASAAAQGGVALQGPCVHRDGIAGPVFGPTPPYLYAREEDWQGVSWIVLGREGARGHRWRTAFRPDPARRSQSLPRSVAARGPGWYFLRIYDRDHQLLDSLDFRFVPGLRAVELTAHPALPGPEGHRPLLLSVVGEAPVRLRAWAPVAGPWQGPGAEIPADPAWDSSVWEVGGPSASVRLRVQTRRLWWRTRSPDTAWTDRPLTLERAWLRATSSASLLFRGPREAAVLKVGFSAARARPCRRRLHEDRAEWDLTLSDLGDEEAWQPSSSPVPLWAWLDGAGPAMVATLAPQAMACTACDFTALDEEEWVLHLLGRHREAWFRPASYQEILHLRPHDEWPGQVVRCPDCGFFVPVARGVDPNQRMDDHYRNHHMQDRMHRNYGLALEPVHDAAEIRKYLGMDLPFVQVCKACSQHISAETEADLLPALKRHLQAHRDRLFRAQDGSGGR